MRWRWRRKVVMKTWSRDLCSTVNTSLPVCWSSLIWICRDLWASSLLLCCSCVRDKLQRKSELCGHPPLVWNSWAPHSWEKADVQNEEWEWRRKHSPCSQSLNHQNTFEVKPKVSEHRKANTWLMVSEELAGLFMSQRNEKKRVRWEEEWESLLFSVSASLLTHISLHSESHHCSSGLLLMFLNHLIMFHADCTITHTQKVKWDSNIHPICWWSLSWRLNIKMDDASPLPPTVQKGNQTISETNKEPLSLSRQICSLCELLVSRYMF